MGTKLYVGNLSYQTTEIELRDLFATAGEVVSASVITDRDTGRSRGFAFVEMGSDRAARDAIQQLNGKSVGGRELQVNEARPRQDRDTRGGGGSGGSGGYSDSRGGGGRRGGSGGSGGSGGYGGSGGSGGVRWAAAGSRRRP